MSNARNIARLLPSNTGQITPAGVPTGSVIQVVTGYDGSYSSLSVGAGTTTNWVSATINRKTTNSRILIMFSGCYGQSTGVDSGVRINSSLDGRLTAAEGNSSGNGAMRSVYSIGTDRGGTNSLAGTSAYFMDPVSFHYLYTPSNTTSSITITTQIYVEGAMTIYPNGDGWRGSGEQSHNTGAHLILMEISA